MAVRSFDNDPNKKNPVGQSIVSWPPTLAATVKEPYQGVSRGEKLVPLIYYTKAGLWEGEPFTLCGPDSSVCQGDGLAPLKAKVAYGTSAASLGANVLEAI